MSKWIKKDDKVLVITGNDKGKVGTVLSCDQLGSRVTVSGVNVRKKHRKRTQQNQKAIIEEIERPIHFSNVSLCDAEGKAVSIQVRKNAKGNKELYYVSSKGKETTLRELKKRGKHV